MCCLTLLISVCGQREKKQRSRSFLKVSEKAKFEQDLEEVRKLSMVE